MSRTTRMWKSIVTGLVVTLAAVGLTAPVANAADLTRFDPGNIVSDAVMYDGNDLSAAAAQSVLDTRGSRCVASSAGVPCLKDFRMATTNKAADDRCSGYTGRASESAAEIITNVARACGISSRSLIVMLQKEQGLVTASGASLTSRRYEIAMGFGCPDTAPCDQQYYGFFNQVFRAAWQLETYRLFPNRYGHRAGVVNNVRFHPNAACGTSPVLIQNAATAGLYNYTPYQPNASALAAGYGNGDSCASYGNRNFYQFFVDWFGSPSIAVSGAIGRFYNSGGAAERLGAATSNEQDVLDGHWQAFQNGDIYLNPRGAWMVLGPLRDVFRAHDGPRGPLGWPRGGDACPSTSMCRQAFDNGTIFTEWTAGTHAVIGPIAELHSSMGGADGALGVPTQGRTTDRGAWVQRFQGGRIFSSGSGTAALTGFLDTWYSGAARVEQLGAPVSNSVATSYGVRQQFASGSVHLTPSSATVVSGPISRHYAATGGDAGPLGRPLSDAVCQPTWCVQDFSGGRIYTEHRSGTWSVTASAAAALDRAGGVAVLGFPTAAPSSALGGAVQTFERGLIFSGSGASSVLRGYLLQWHGGVPDRRGLGAPTSDEEAVGSGVQQQFRSGSAYLTPDGTAYAVLGAVDTAYRAAGGPRGAIGWPTGAETCDATGCYQQFDAGRLYRSDASAVTLKGGMLRTYLGQRLAEQLGSPVSAEVVTSSGVVQRFSTGSLTLRPTSWNGLYGPIHTAYWRDGGPGSAVGLARAAASCPSSNWCSQAFDGGTMYTAHGAGTWSVIGPMETFIQARGGVTTAGLGFPTGPRRVVGSGFEQSFQNGTLVQDPAGRVSVR